MKATLAIAATIIATSCVRNPSSSNQSNSSGNGTSAENGDCTSFLPPECQHDDKTFRCVKYVSNYDGDTIRFQVPGVHPLLGKNISIRVLGIDTPEKFGPLPCESQRADDARKLVKALMTGAKNIELRNIGRDKYFRILADVFADEKSVSEELIKAGLAYRYFGETKEKRNWCTGEVMSDTTSATTSTTDTAPRPSTAPDTPTPSVPPAEEVPLAP